MDFKVHFHTRDESSNGKNEVFNFSKIENRGEKRSEIQKKHKIVQNVPKKLKNEQFLEKSLW